MAISDSGSISFDGGGLYIHVAYCRSKCIYCDFFSAGDRIADWSRYIDALCSEFVNRKNEMAWPLRTIYIGGGTPSLIPESEFSRLCSFLSPYMEEVEEFTLEVNPDDVDADRLRFWREQGVNRLSIGIQSFEDSALSAIGRRHDGKTAIRAYELARREFDNISIDLMFGLPGQTTAVWRKDLLTAISLRPQHISAYSLMYEEGTVLTSLRDTGRLTEASESTTEEMFLMLIEQLSKAGYDHYEISNFALPGFRSRHNSSYWLQKPYLGLGPSAHSYDGKLTRKANRADLRGYLNYWSPGTLERNEKDIPSVSEILNPEELKEEYVLTRMRMREGIPIEDFRFRFGESAYLGLREKAEALSGRLYLTATHISLKEDAILLSDAVILDLVSDS